MKKKKKKMYYEHLSCIYYGEIYVEIYRMGEGRAMYYSLGADDVERCSPSGSWKIDVRVVLQKELCNSSETAVARPVFFEIEFKMVFIS